jgi:surface protein
MGYSNVVDMISMFSDASAFNSDISQWDTSDVNDMSSMFDYAKAFNSDISQWDVSKVSKMEDMFKNAVSFNRNISQWDIAKVTDMARMFTNAASFNQSLCSWLDTLSPELNVVNVFTIGASMFLNTSCPNPNNPINPTTNNGWVGSMCYNCV